MGIEDVAPEGDPLASVQDWLITPPTAFPGAAIDCGLAGTVMRFLPAVAALGRPGPPGRRRRGQGPADGPGHRRAAVLGVELEDSDGFLPLTVLGRGRVRGGR